MIKDKVRKRVEGWKRKLLSVGRRHVLIKAVGEAIPIYSLSCFLLPDSLLTEIHGILSQFWWGQKGGERRMSWVSWKSMTRPKKEGDMDFKDLRAQNLALLEKQCWRIATRPNSLLTKMLKEKYYRYQSIMEAGVGAVPSWGWRSILEGRKVLKKGLLWKVGSGGSIRVYVDPWLPSPHPHCAPMQSATTRQSVT
nr:uncharacterized protein LOC112705199 [Arachis hypogaea]